MVYLAKFILCSGLFYLAYRLLFEKERMHQFKRFYLLFTLALSFAIPLITIETKVEAAPAEVMYLFTPVANNVSSSQSPTVSQSIEQTSIVPFAFFAIYIGITTLLLGRFIKNMILLVNKIKNGKKSSWQGVTLILNPKESAAYSFMNYIFVSQTDYENHTIDEGILQHELAHVKQKHSIDVVIIELLQIFLWFNPLLIFYRKAIQTNHEYLADESAIHHYPDASTYQLVLINYIAAQSGLSLTSQFNYLTLKKRLTMMSKRNSLRVAFGRQLLLIPFLGLALFLFSTKIEAQEAQKKSNVQDKTVGLNDVEQKEYKALVDKYFGPQGNKYKGLTLNKAELARLESIFKSMSSRQKDSAKISFVQFRPLTPKSPSETQLSYWQSKRFGVWIDGKRIENSKLKDFKPADFSYWSTGYLTKRAVNYGKLDYEIYLMTNAEFKLKEKTPRTAMLINNGKNTIKFRNSTRL